MWPVVINVEGKNQAEEGLDLAVVTFFSDADCLWYSLLANELSYRLLKVLVIEYTIRIAQIHRRIY